MPYFLALTILLAPAYVVRFGLFGLPTNVLMVWLGILWIVCAIWLVREHKVADFFAYSARLNRAMLVFIALFFVAGIVSVCTGGVTLDKLGQFIVWFIQPIGTYFIVRYVALHDTRTKGMLTGTLYYIVGIAGVYALIQYFTLAGLPVGWWGNSEEPKRAISFFVHPNAYALFVAPILAFLIPHTAAALQHIRTKKQSVLLVMAWGVGAIGLLLSLSRGGWLGLFAAVVLFVIASMNKRIMIAALLAFVSLGLVIAAVPNLRYRVLLPFHGEKSSVARLSLWQTGGKMIADSPVLGKGLLGFKNNWTTYNTDPNLEVHPAPHNIFLNFWVETGLLGLLSFVGLSVFALIQGLRKRVNLYALGLALFVAALLVHGQIDVPYFKNDLALLYWIMLGAFL